MEIIDQTAKVVMLKGEGGDTIKSIDKTTTQGLVDIYTITLESGNKTTFNVTNGNGIKTIEKTSTSGLIDTYTITFDNGETTTFTVTNGEKGEKGDKGDTGPQGPQGPKGEKGDPGDGGGIANVDTELSATSTNPVQNKAIAEGINSINERLSDLEEAVDISTEEHIIGSFMGKPLYSKTINARKTSSDKQIVNHGIENVDVIWLDVTNTFLHNNNNGLSFSYFFTGVNADSTRNFANEYLSFITNVDATKITIRNGTNTSNNKISQWYITLKYTKTTD